MIIIKKKRALRIKNMGCQKANNFVTVHYLGPLTHSCKTRRIHTSSVKDRETGLGRFDEFQGHLGWPWQFFKWRSNTAHVHLPLACLFLELQRDLLTKQDIQAAPQERLYMKSLRTPCKMSQTWNICPGATVKFQSQSQVNNFIPFP